MKGFDEREVIRATEAIALGHVADTLYVVLARSIGIPPRIEIGCSPLLTLATAATCNLNEDGHAH